ncbi:hypothetical protein QYE76_040285 [Lolium multiflorum]|uniref:Transposase-associated domain-containing protein n=1 Tax=Lolium multiflorum TaxID=4521 RepID=A0AAD8TCP0_LOLMU|nr:hypothetical protein QYE76_040285 [Lolium multiflorum]
MFSCSLAEYVMSPCVTANQVKLCKLASTFSVGKFQKIFWNLSSCSTSCVVAAEEMNRMRWSTITWCCSSPHLCLKHPATVALVDLVEPPKSVAMAEKVTFAGHLGEPKASHNAKTETWENLSVDLRSNNELVSRYKDVLFTTLAGMSHPWMYGNRLAPAFREGVNSFLLVAEANKSKQGFMFCPCLKCKNEKDYSCSRDIKSHLLRFGFMSSYNVWTKHGEEGVMMEDGDEEEDNDDQYRSMFSEFYDDTAMEDNEADDGGEERAPDDPVDDDLRRAISDARRDCGTYKERLQFDKMLEDHHKLLYPGCEDGQRKLGSVLELLKWKAEVGVTDSGLKNC